MKRRTCANAAIARLTGQRGGFTPRDVFFIRLRQGYGIPMSGLFPPHDGKLKHASAAETARIPPVLDGAAHRLRPQSSVKCWLCKGTTI